jgi:hypothetical protein
LIPMIRTTWNYQEETKVTERVDSFTSPVKEILDL